MTAAPDLLDTAEAIALLGTTRPTLYRWLRAGRLEGQRAGRQWRFERSELERFLRGDEPRVSLRADIAPLLDALERLAGDDAPRLPLAASTEIDQAVLLTLRAALARGANTIHLEPDAGATRGLHIRMRVGGRLEPVATIDSRLAAPLILAWKRLTGCEAVAPGRLAEGLVEIENDGVTLSVHAEFVPARGGDSVAVQLLHSQNVLGLDALRLREPHSAQLRRWSRMPHGLVLCSGPTGSGKTTVLFACVLEVAGPSRKVMSLEEPVEYPIPWTSQVSVDEDDGLPFDRAMRAVLRSDPDAILIGELDRGEKVRAAHRAALTGHMVFSSLHADSTSRALERLVELSADPLAISDLQGLIVSQRLVRRLCKECREPVEIGKRSRRFVQSHVEAGGLTMDDLEGSFHRAVGCDTCRDLGFRGRSVVFEMMELTAALRTAVRQGAGESELRRAAIAGGMVTLQADAMRLASLGETSLEEAARVLGLDLEE